MSRERAPVVVRHTRADDFEDIIRLSRLVYPQSPPWSSQGLTSHLEVFPEGQFVAVDEASGRIVGMAASLILHWDEYHIHTTWREITAEGTFRNHDPTGRTLYAAEVMVEPGLQGRGIGKRLYAARRDLARRLRLRRIRAGARLRGYHHYADQTSAEEYVIKVVRGELADPTLTFQLRQHFRVIAVVPNYLRFDPDSLGYAALIEWINHDVARPKDYEARDSRFLPERSRPGRDQTR